MSSTYRALGFRAEDWRNDATGAVGFRKIDGSGLAGAHYYIQLWVDASGEPLVTFHVGPHGNPATPGDICDVDEDPIVSHWPVATEPRGPFAIPPRETPARTEQENRRMTPEKAQQARRTRTVVYVPSFGERNGARVVTGYLTSRIVKVLPSGWVDLSRDRTITLKFDAANPYHVRTKNGTGISPYAGQYDAAKDEVTYPDLDGNDDGYVSVVRLEHVTLIRPVIGSVQPD